MAVFNRLKSENNINKFMDTHSELFKVRRKPLTEWDEFKTLDYAKIYQGMTKPDFFFDERHMLPHETITDLGEKEQVQASLSMITAIQNFLMVPMKLGAGTMLTHFGVMYGIMFLPLKIFCFASSTYFLKSIQTVIFTRELYNAVYQAIFNPALQLLWLPFQENERRRFQNFVSGPVRSLSRIVVAVLSMVLTTIFVVELVGASCSSVLMIATSILWLLDAMASRQSYASEFYASLRQGHLDLTSSILDFTPDQIQLVKETLVNGEPNHAHFVLNSLSHKHIASYAQELRAFFTQKRRKRGLPYTFAHKAALVESPYRSQACIRAPCRRILLPPRGQEVSSGDF
ncbi:hypothetical protein PsorP6_001348 [Peronosclerospora sorghi]|uniref:Uncharacterized protein n=1 Tax=Peronosclerospora sorghi TaxID=230839 RepID=A0ACC0WSG8_9STRA|nr:hypothetical protein PsorP6_001348 [Peronosclerospora sorghi]